MTHANGKYHATYSTIVMCPETGTTVAQGSGYSEDEALAAAKADFQIEASMYPDDTHSWDEHTKITEKDPVSARGLK